MSQDAQAPPRKPTDLESHSLPFPLGCYNNMGRIFRTLVSGLQFASLGCLLEGNKASTPRIPLGRFVHLRLVVLSSSAGRTLNIPSLSLCFVPRHSFKL